LPEGLLRGTILKLRRKDLEEETYYWIIRGSLIGQELRGGKAST